MTEVVLKETGLKPIWRGHPWIFPKAIARLKGQPAPGEVVKVVGPSGEFLAWGWYSPSSGLRVRLIDRDPAAVIDSDWLAGRLSLAVDRRSRLLAEETTTGLRLVHAEADSLPGLIVDRYGDWLVIQALSSGAEAVKGQVVAWLAERFSPQGIIERSDEEARRLEGLTPGKGLLFGDRPAGPVSFSEHGRTMLVDLLDGQKTGYFLDQRERTGGWWPSGRPG